MPYRKRNKPLRGIGQAVGPFCPLHPNVVWALDFQFDQTRDGRMLKLLNVIDERSRECLAIETARSIDADGVVEVLDRLARERGAPYLVHRGLKTASREMRCGPSDEHLKPYSATTRSVPVIHGHRRSEFRVDVRPIEPARCSAAGHCRQRPAGRDGFPITLPWRSWESRWGLVRV